jgi:acetyl-CoA C-acetyltransferase
MRSVAVLGAAQTVHASRRLDVDLGELCIESIVPAVHESGLEWGEVEMVVFGSGPDLFQGTRNAYLTALTPLIGADRPMVRVHTGGAVGGSAFQTAAVMVGSGWVRSALVIGVEKASEPEDAQAILNTMWDPLFEERLGLNAINMMSLQAVRQMHEHGYREEQFAAVAVKNRGNGVHNPYAQLREAITLEQVLESEMIAYPIKRLESCPVSDGSCALVLGDGEHARRARKPVWVQGVSEGTDSMFIGDRIGDGTDDYMDAATLRLAAHEAYRQAGVTSPREEIDVAEIYAPFPTNEMKACEALGFCERGKADELVESGAMEVGGDMPVNPSGGPMCANPIGATGVVRVAECVFQVRGESEGAQVEGAKRGVATSSGGSSQFYTVAVVGEERP